MLSIHAPITRQHAPAYEGRMERFAVLDVETTSGDPREGHLIEVAVLALDGGMHRSFWETLIAPPVPMPPFAKKLTGIDDTMLIGAPVFREAANAIATLTQDRILVAHNVRYDITALQHEFARIGSRFDRATLCTEKLSRRLIPSLTHYNLGSMCRYFGIPFTARHRAASDTEAASQLLLRLIDGFGEERILQQVEPIPIAAW